MEFNVMMTKELEKVHAIRRRVFIEEQHIPEEVELDQYDRHSDTRHVLLMDQTGEAVGTARFRPYGDDILKIERVAVLAGQRGCGAGSMMMEAIQTEARKAGYRWMKLGAQLHAKAFYERLGYQSQGEVYLDAGIEHIDMVKRLPPAAENR